ncbi:hypothetical protein [Ancylobacter oerskovii]|uniref:Uncharacterized protein n=1 Tax=Ancylobacter oerskovii TaxID=459519 RepID=A0ABW4Z2S3_9HYPH|nr:hypothetical protein [Ancylobacter oerskovii]MBS7544748.1 hypothetical protein [Ancylobacter oerskovii]
MKTLEQTARRICALDLEGKGFPQPTIPQLVDRFWPVVANEIRQGVSLVGEWPFTGEQIEAWSVEYRTLRPG